MNVGSIGSSQSENAQIKKLDAQLKALGLQDQGSVSANLAAVQEAKAEEATSTENLFDSSSSNTQAKQGGANWSSLMESINVEGSGSKTGDAANILTLLESMDSDEAASIASQFNALGLTISLPKNNDEKNA